MAEKFWLRSEYRLEEQRAALVPQEAGSLVRQGFDITVEESPNRIFPIEEYRQQGCIIADEGSWTGTPKDTIILGLKELPVEPEALHHRHIFFGHAFKGQADAPALLTRFKRGGGTLLDLEYLTDNNGRRLVAFGYWAGYMGAALGILQLAGRLDKAEPGRLEDLNTALQACADIVHNHKVLVIGANGRCGSGATDALARASLSPTPWDIEETRNLDKQALLCHDMLINTVGISGKASPFLTIADLHAERQLKLLVDVTCDMGSPANAVPVYDRLTSWQQPMRRIEPAGAANLDLIAIDNLPSLLPREASTDFSSILVNLLAEIESADFWSRARATFQQAMEKVAV